MASNLAQVFAANPVTVIGDTDLFYIVVGGTTDGGISGATLKGYFASIDDVQNEAYNTFVDSGVADVYAGDLSPAIVSYTDGLRVKMLTSNDNQTTTPTVNLNTIGAVPITLPNGTPVAVNDIRGGAPAEMEYSSFYGSMVLQNPAASLQAAYYSVFGQFIRVDDIGVADAYEGSNIFYPAAGGDNCMFVALLPNNDCTGASTFDLNSLGNPYPIQISEGVDTQAGDIKTDQTAFLVFQNISGTYWQLLNPQVTGASSVSPQQIQDQSFTTGIGAGGVGTGTIAFTTNPSFLAYANGQRFSFQADSDSISASYTVDINTVGAVGLVNQDGSAIKALQMVSGGIYNIEYDINIGAFRLINPYIGAVFGTKTNDNAAAGFVGEYLDDIILQASPVSLTTATDTNVATVQLTEGDWDVWGNVTFIPDPGVTVVTTMTGWINDDSATLPDPAFYSAFDRVGIMSISAGMSAPAQRFTVINSTTLDVYLSCRADFSVSTLAACGAIYARRRR